jgi:hypothetical protein
MFWGLWMLDTGCCLLGCPGDLFLALGPYLCLFLWDWTLVGGFISVIAKADGGLDGSETGFLSGLCWKCPKEPIDTLGKYEPN